MPFSELCGRCLRLPRRRSRLPGALELPPSGQIKVRTRRMVNLVSLQQGHKTVEIVSSTEL